MFNKVVFERIFMNMENRSLKENTRFNDYVFYSPFSLMHYHNKLTKRALRVQVNKLHNYRYGMSRGTARLEIRHLNIYNMAEIRYVLSMAWQERRLNMKYHPLKSPSSRLV